MMVVRYRVDEHNSIYHKLKRMEKELKELIDCVEDKDNEAQEEMKREDYEEEYRYDMRGGSGSRGGRYGYRMSR